MKPGFHERISRFLYLEMEAKRKKQKKLRSAAAWFCLLAAVFLTACGQGRAGEKEGLEYEVVTEAELPAELASIISEKKEGEFKLTYVCDGSLYLVAGMGQPEDRRLQHRGEGSVSSVRIHLPGAGDHGAGAGRTGVQCAVLPVSGAAAAVPGRAGGISLSSRRRSWS